MTEIAAEVADGILVMPFNSAAHLAERTMPAVARGSRRADGTRTTSRSSARRSSAMGDTEEQIAAATAGVKGLLSFYGSTPVVPARARRRRLG